MKKEIKAEIWEVKICGSALDMVHNNYQTIIELYITSEKISCNLANECLHCFETYDGRYKGNKLVKETTVPLIFVRKAKEYIKIQEELRVNLKNYLEPKIETTYPIKNIPPVPSAVRGMPFTIPPVKK